MSDSLATVEALLAELGPEWPTPEAIATARAAMIARIPGWTLPAAHGLAVEGPEGFDFPRVNAGVNPLPAVVMATVLGHSGGSASYEVDSELLALAIRLLAPAEACTAYEHPNLATWREVREALVPGAAARMVFVGELSDDSDDPAVTSLRALV
ncbi:hypothetical protein [Glycomyces artemisiae]|uniref:Uncharacterized protein n=1 Tax=Glycomyces artemisiae TaxID=1076443 RepID=A0A2T0UTG6_9ACTN|nr:hypothetical protein [Glycomyces artemisiae]PRY61200.1 hypothetical protein B0I28_102821 [Glycomyces artemisiae]